MPDPAQEPKTTARHTSKSNLSYACDIVRRERIIVLPLEPLPRQLMEDARSGTDENANLDDVSDVCVRAGSDSLEAIA